MKLVGINRLFPMQVQRMSRVLIPLRQVYNDVSSNDDVGFDSFEQPGSLPRM